jgi:hypothetical protein
LKAALNFLLSLFILQLKNKNLKCCPNFGEYYIERFKFFTSSCNEIRSPP